MRFVFETVHTHTERQFEKYATALRRRIAHHGVRVLGMSITSEVAVLPQLIVDRMLEFIRDREFGNPHYIKLRDSIACSKPILRMVVWEPTETATQSLETGGWSWGQVIYNKRGREDEMDLVTAMDSAFDCGATFRPLKRLAIEPCRPSCGLPQYSPFAVGDTLGSYEHTSEVSI